MPGPYTPLTPNPPPQATIQNFIRSYLYTTYSEDQDIAALVEAFNELAQGYLDWFNETALADYASEAVSGDLLDWVAEGLYGVTRQALPTGTNKQIGPLNTFAFNTLAMNQIEIEGPTDFFATSDDVF